MTSDFYLPSNFPFMLDACFKPRTHPWHVFDKDTQEWKSVRPPWPAAVPQIQYEPTKTRVIDDLPEKEYNVLRLITWSIDAFVPFTRERVDAALDHLNKFVLPPYTKDSPPVIIMFQEMVEAGIEQVRKTKWVQERFAITNFDTRGFDAPYGTLTLIQVGEAPGAAKEFKHDMMTLRIANVFRVRWLSKFWRDGLFVDIEATVTGKNGCKETKALRICNTHLDSLSSAHPIRPQQVAKATSYLEEEIIHGGVLAGDMNAIQASDDRIAEDNKLKDAYLVLGGEEGVVEGCTWGYQRTSDKHEYFRPERLDKVFYRGGFVARALTRIGMGVVVEGEETKARMMARGLGFWVTDHYGLMADLEIVEVVEVKEKKEN
ncbi:uncharacterized protein GIQ15_03450 [Arthroderma uncinatum]|uniref:uncharacterized protein n=1 Tax=Arthroderma uncinatum TaxID=74035 RepID=UPI00144AE983|nr:uncharacterized protein GIQ15_03450 [Arthroderma uncinatum]KAF3484126.1 hypothetical protein GIQ15_03450 [Arthroderma uncinatum]